jgi:hypothetical protein
VPGFAMPACRQTTTEVATIWTIFSPPRTALGQQYTWSSIDGLGMSSDREKIDASNAEIMTLMEELKPRFFEELTSVGNCLDHRPGEQTSFPGTFGDGT